MNIALFGYGTMGKLIEEIAVSRNHRITHIVRSGDLLPDLEGTDMAIDFSVPSSALRNIKHCFSRGIPVVSGTTGWLEKYQEAVEACTHHRSGFLYASNFSLGVNLFFALTEKLGALMKGHEEYRASLTEIHHTRKLDAPSGTAITLAERLLPYLPQSQWNLRENATPGDLPIEAIRRNDVPGTHTITYESEVDRIDITHTAHNRNGFALGAVMAAEWLVGRKGVFSMKDVLNLS